jgi:hypothetical protein
MKKTIISIALILFSNNPVWANNYVLSFDAKQIENGNYPQLTVWSGSGLTLNFTALKDESVKSLWLDDPSKLVVDYAGQLCSLPCRGGVNIVHLKRVTGLNFDNLPATARTTLTVVTVSPEGDKVYKFILGYGGGAPKYLAVNLTPPVKQRPLPPLFHRRQLPAHPKPVTKVALIDSERIDLLKQGLEVARQKLKPTTRNKLLLNRFELFISQLESGDREEDARKSNSISVNAVQLIADFGWEQKVSEIEDQENNTSVTETETKTASVPKTEIDEPKNPLSADKPHINEEQKPAFIAKAEVNEKTMREHKPKLITADNVEEEASNSREMANYIARGLLVAGNKKQINYRTRTYFKVQSAIRSLRRGETLTQAAKIAKIKLSVLEQLLVWGQQ